MKITTLGNSGIQVTCLGFGTLTMSPLQRNLSIDEGASLLLDGFHAGIRFLDTAQSYGSYPQVGKALSAWKGARITIASKSAAMNAENMKKAIEECRQALGQDCIDIFLLHAVKNPTDFERRYPALEELLRAKDRGYVRAIGASSHSVAAMRALGDHPAIQILHPIMNRDGIGVLDATRDGYRQVLHLARNLGKGIYGMKPLGGGHLRHDAETALRWAFNLPELDALAVGMTSRAEVLMNCALARGEPVTPILKREAALHQRSLFINTALCTGCGACVKSCDQQALTLKNEKAVVKRSSCILCGYCAPKCPIFAIRIV